jgi:hypothetical protein
MNKFLKTHVPSLSILTKSSYEYLKNSLKGSDIPLINNLIVLLIWTHGGLSIRHWTKCPVMSIGLSILLHPWKRGTSGFNHAEAQHLTTMGCGNLPHMHSTKKRNSSHTHCRKVKIAINRDMNHNNVTIHPWCVVFSLHKKLL